MVGAIIMWIFAVFMAVAVMGLSFGLRNPGWFGRLWCGGWMILLSVLGVFLVWGGVHTLVEAFSTRAWRFEEPSIEAGGSVSLDRKKQWSANGYRQVLNTVEPHPLWGAIPWTVDGIARVGSCREGLTQLAADPAVVQELNASALLAFALLRLAGQRSIRVTSHASKSWYRAPNQSNDHSEIQWISLQLLSASAVNPTVLERAILDVLIARQAPTLIAEPGVDGADPYRSQVSLSDGGTRLTLYELSQALLSAESPSLVGKVLLLSSNQELLSEAEQDASVDVTDMSFIESDRPTVSLFLKMCEQTIVAYEDDCYPD